MRCNHPSFVQISTLGRVIAFPTVSYMAAVCHLKLEFCHYGPPTKSTMRLDHCVKIWCRSDCDFMICQFGWKMPNRIRVLGGLIV